MAERIDQGRRSRPCSYASRIVPGVFRETRKFAKQSPSFECISQYFRSLAVAFALHKGRLIGIAFVRLPGRKDFR